MGVIINGKDYDVPGLNVLTPAHDPRFGLRHTDRRIRPTTWVRGIVLHTTRGIPGGRITTPQVIHPGKGPDHRRDEKVAIMWSLDDRKAGAHLICDSDGSWVCTCDLQRIAAYHAGKVNPVTIGIEIYQEPDGSMYAEQLQSVVKMVDFLTISFGIQRQYHSPYHGQAMLRGLQGGYDMVGIYGHRDASNNRDLGDPGDAIFDALGEAGYECFDFRTKQDLLHWSHRQDRLGLLPDGIAGPKTTHALAAQHYHHGLWVSRPGD